MALSRMNIDPARIAKWRERAQYYRACMTNATEPGTKLAYRALSECADRLADQILRGEIGLKPPIEDDPEKAQSA
jgi:hypothetical protein